MCTPDPDNPSLVSTKFVYISEDNTRAQAATLCAFYGKYQ